MKVFALFIFLISNTAAFAQTQALSQLVYEIRNPQTQPARFREALETIGEYLALNVVEELNTEEMTIRTLTETDAKHRLTCETPVLVTILRAGLPLNVGVQKVFPSAEVGFLAMSRNEETLIAKVEYVALPSLENRCVVLSDTMLATGGSLLDAIQIVERYGPKKIFVITAIASEPGIARILQYNPNIKIFAAAIDPSLNDKGYIIPGLGDAGDRSYGKKQSQIQYMSGHVFVVSEWLPKENCEEELWKQFKQLMALTLKNESGCIRAHATRQIPHQGSPGKSKYKIVLLQEYVDVKAFDIHCNADYVTNCFKNYVEDEKTSLVKEWRCRLFSEDE